MWVAEPTEKPCVFYGQFGCLSEFDGNFNL